MIKSEDVIKLRILRQDYLGLFRWFQCNHKGPYKKAERSVKRQDNANESMKQKQNQAHREENDGC